MQYITIKDGVITGLYCGGNIKAGAVVLPEGAQVAVGERVAWYNDMWQRKDDITLMREGLVPLPCGYVWADEGKGALRAMSGDERIIAGVDAVPDDKRIVDGEVVDLYEWLKGLDEDALEAEGDESLIDKWRAIKKDEAMAYLRATDYIAAKIAEGAATREEYSGIIAKQAQARDEINRYDAK